MRTDRSDWTRWLAGAAAELRRARRIRGAHRRTRRRIARLEAQLALVLLLAPAGAGAAPPVFLNTLEPFGLVGVDEGIELVALADIDGDGDLDAFVHGYYLNIGFAENTGSATAPAFAAPVSEWFGISDLEEAPRFADLDGDDDVDLLVPDFETLRVYENTGTATAPSFAGPTHDDFGAPDVWGARTSFADIDGDADLDVLALRQWFVGYSHMLFVPNVGTPAVPEFTSPLRPFGLDGTIQGGTLVDLDGDGDLDLVTRDEYTMFVENTGTAGLPVFAAPVADPFGLALGYIRPAFADLDGDGDLDAFSSYGYDFVHRENTGSATAPAFAPRVTGAFGLSHTSYLELAFGDLDGDGDLDLLLGCGTSTSFAANTGSPTAPAFAEPIPNTFGIPLFSQKRNPTLVDLDGDADLDLVLTRYGLPTLVQENTGSVGVPAFALPQVGPPGLETALLDATFGDLDGDGDLDVLANAGGLGPVWFENVGSAAEPSFLSFVDRFGLFGGFEASGPALGDLDADGDLDAIARWTLDRTLTLYANTGSAQAPAFTPADLVGPVFGGSNHLGDVDGDGDLDLFVGAPTATLFVENRGSPEEPAFVSRLDPFGSPPYGYDDVSIADLDGDGDLDVFGQRYDGEEEVVYPVFVENVGNRFHASFAAAVVNPFGLDSVYIERPAFVDLDGDGDLDVLSRGEEGFAFHPNTGSATAPAFAAPVSAPFGLPGTGWLGRPAVADLDGDGDQDVFTEDDVVTTYYENTGTAGLPAFAAAAPNPFGLTGTNNPVFTFGDVDGDGDLDALRGEYYGGVDFLENTGSATAPAFAAAVRSVNTPRYAEPTLADLDGDGDLDLYVAFGFTHTIEMPNLAAVPVCPVEPAPDCAGAFAKTSLTIDERKAGKESLRIAASRGPALAAEALGDPTVPDGSAVAACLYDGEGELVAPLTVDRAGESCGAKPCWSETRAPGIAYSDPAAAEDGVRSLRLDAGKAARFKLLARNNARKDQRALPRGVADALSSSASITLQVHVADGACVSAELTPVKVKPGLLKAK